METMRCREAVCHTPLLSAASQTCFSEHSSLLTPRSPVWRRDSAQHTVLLPCYLLGRHKTIESLTFVEMSTQPVLSALCLVVLDVVHLFKTIIVDSVLFVVMYVRRSVYGLSDKKVISNFFQGRTVLITGASSGLGEAIALELAKTSGSMGNKPVNIFLASRSVDKLDLVAKECRLLSAKSIVEVIFIDMATLTEESGGTLDTFMAAMNMKLKRNSLSGIDCLIANAGVSSRGAALETPEHVLRNVMNVNFFGPVALTRAITQDLKKRGCGGHIAVVSSVQGKLGLPFRSSYASSKHAVQGYFDSLRGELHAYGIDVTIISPGYISTNLSRNAVTTTGEKYGKMDDTTKNGMNAKYAAQQCLLAIVNNIPDFVLADGKSLTAINGKVQFPGLLAGLMSDRAKKNIPTHNV